MTKSIAAWAVSVKVWRSLGAHSLGAPALHFRLENCRLHPTLRSHAVTLNVRRNVSVSQQQRVCWTVGLYLHRGLWFTFSLHRCIPVHIKLCKQLGSKLCSNMPRLHFSFKPQWIVQSTHFSFPGSTICAPADCWKLADLAIWPLCQIQQHFGESL